MSFLIGLNGFSKNGKTFKIFTVYCGTMVTCQLSAFILTKNHINNLFISHFYFVLQFLILSLFYLSILKQNFQKKMIKFGLALCPLLLIIQYSLYPEFFFKFNLFEIFITSLLLIIYATFHLYNLLNENKEYYYFTLGLLIYLFGSTVIFLAINLIIMLPGKKTFYAIFDLNVYLYIIYQLFVLYELKKYILKKE
jgi:hypothetical protein